LANQGSGILKFPKLSKVIHIVLSLPHSNTDAERTFSVTGLKKTDITDCHMIAHCDGKFVSFY